MTNTVIIKKQYKPKKKEKKQHTLDEYDYLWDLPDEDKVEDEEG